MVTNGFTKFFASYFHTYTEEIVKKTILNMRVCYKQVFNSSQNKVLKYCFFFLQKLFFTDEFMCSQYTK